MPLIHAIELFFDSDSDAKVRSIWSSLAAADIASLSSEHELYRPHVSLSVFENAGPEKVIVELTPPAPVFRRLVLTLSSVGLFPGTGVLFLGVTVTDQLLRAHAVMEEILERAGTEPWGYYRSGTWVPHCTLAMAVEMAQTGTALRLALEAPLPITVEITAMGVVEVPSGRICHTIELEGR